MGAKPDPLAVLVLAAGQGTRMKSERAKVLHEICGLPMLEFPLSAAEGLSPQELVVVVGRDAEQVRGAFEGRARFVLQPERRGTGHAVQLCQPPLADFRGDVLILYGDTPLLRSETLQRMRECKAETGADLVLLTAPVDVRGIVIRDDAGRVSRIVESTDATPEQQRIRERNTGVYLLDAELLWKVLAQVGDQNAQGEIYLTDIVELTAAAGRRVEALRLDDADEAMGCDDRAQLARAAAIVRQRTLNRWMIEGVSIVDPATTYVDVGVEIGRDTVIEPGCVIQGESRIGSGVHLKPGCMIESSEIGDETVIGPNAHLRPGTVLGRGCRIGNFVEVKNSTLGDGCKADHLSYIGDADVGAGSSFGCGAITVNYDWKSKHRTTVGERVFVGCNVNLVAPVTLASDSYVAAGSTITHDVPGDSLAVARNEQRIIEGWVSRRAGASDRKRGSQG